ncbi:Mov34/MPN/PAD-1 family protein [Methylobacterium sp. J-076]|nr:Mov34/MPN/PAD-1 family protein [Methylobacterium sp. J-076]
MPDDGHGQAVAVLAMDSNLPSRWLARGHSDNGVRAIEPVKVVFGKHFPWSAPTFNLRDDFDRSHPHLQPWGPGRPPEPCVVFGSATELMRSRGFTGLLDQMADWLERAAEVRLIDPAHGWEPTRRDDLHDTAIVDAAWARSLQKRDEGCTSFEATYRAAAEADGTVSTYFVTLSDTSMVIRDGIRGDWTFSENDGIRAGRTIGLVAWSGKAPNGSPFVGAKYLPETVTDVRSLLMRAADLGCGDQLRARLDLVQQRMQGRSFKIPMPLLVILLVRRPSNLIGTSSAVEMLPYVIEVEGNADLSPTSVTPVRIAMHRDQISVDLLRGASGEESGDRPGWTLIGCGSVGSKIAVHMGRAGLAPSLVIDRKVMAPHNMARHALLPRSPGASISWKKSEFLAQALSCLAQPPRMLHTNVAGALVSSEKDPADIMPGDHYAVVNATASISVREALALGRVATRRPRVIETCLLAGGKIGYVAVEGPNANPRTDDLAVEAYRLLGDDPSVNAEVFGSWAEARAIEIGQGCSSLTFPMPDALLSAMTAPMATMLTRYQSSGLPDDCGHLVLGKLAADGLGLSWERTVVSPFVEADPAQPGVLARISGRVHDAICREVASKAGSETGGVIVGRFSEASETFHVVDLIEAPPDSRFSPEEFVLGTQGLRDRIVELVKRTNGTIYPLGTWHNHLVSSGPSATDLSTALLLAPAQTTPLLMLIHTPDGYRRIVSEVVRRPGTDRA